MGLNMKAMLASVAQGPFCLLGTDSNKVHYDVWKAIHDSRKF